MFSAAVSVILSSFHSCAGIVPAQTQHGQAQFAQAVFQQGQHGQALTTQVPHGQVQREQALLGHAPLGQEWLGHAQLGQTQLAPAPLMLPQLVTGELSPSPIRNVSVKGLALSADHPDHLMLFRTYVSRKAPMKGRAVLEGVGHDSGIIEACFGNTNEEAAVQAGLIKWKDGQGRQPPTWDVLLKAMEYANIAQEHVQGLKKALDLLQ